MKRDLFTYSIILFSFHLITPWIIAGEERFATRIDNDTISDIVDTKENGDATVRLYYLKGRLVGKRSGRANASDPINNLEWDTANVAPGIYVFSLRATDDDGTTGTVRKKFSQLR